MAESFALSGYQNIQSSEIYQDDQTVLNKGAPEYIMEGQLDEFSLAHYEFPPSFEGKMPTNMKALSSHEIVELAGTRYMKGFAYGGLDSYFVTPALATEDQHGLELAHLLFTSADMISNKQYDQAAKLVMQCRNFSSQSGNPIQRICYYFSGALQERIERQTYDGLRNPLKLTLDVADNCKSGYNRTEVNSLIAFSNRVLPYVKLVQLTAVQAIIESVADASKIHVIDLETRTGCQWSVLMQSLAVRPTSDSLKLLRITSVGTSWEELKENGRRLHEFANSLALPFSYRMVQISSMEEIHEGLFNVKPGETVAVYVPNVFQRLLYKRTLLESVVDVLKKLRPRIMVNIEVEAAHNSPCFNKRFIELLFHSSACFDSLDVIMPDRHDTKRIRYEEIFCGSAIRNIIACEMNDRRIRHVKTDVWRCFFRHKGLKELSFSYQAWYHARLLLEQFPHGDCYTLEANGSAIIFGWKGTPVQAVTAWTCN